MRNKVHSAVTIGFLIFVLCLSLAKVDSVSADEGTPTDVPVVEVSETETEESTEPSEVPSMEGASLDATSEPGDASPSEAPVDTTLEPVDTSPADAVQGEESVPELLGELPENTDVVVVSAEGEIVSLASQDAVEIAEVADPMWCPAGTNPNGANCHGFSSFALLLEDMRLNPTTYDENGVVYLEKPVSNFTTSFIIDDSLSSLSSSYTTLRNYNLTIQGGWNGGGSSTVTGQTTFDGAGAFLQIGNASNPWVGNIVINGILFQNVSNANSVTVYTSSGNISLSNVDVREQAGGFNTALLSSTSGSITVGSGSSFDGNSSGSNAGFAATSSSGSISISGSDNVSGVNYTFRESTGSNNGATLSAPTVTLNNVIARGNGGNGIAISGATTVTLNTVTAGASGNDNTCGPGTGGACGNGGSGVYVNGTGTSPTVNIIGGSFNRNGRYGIEIISGYANVTTQPTYGANTKNNTNANGLGTLSVSAPDSDSDGVPDGNDLCPNTPASQPVDANGCTASQLDSDGDGVLNPVDQCPNTPAGQPADANGCAASQLDSDGDGISNAEDQCPTEAGPASNNGCPVQTPTDTDGDGVPDNTDQCPSEAGSASNNGCPIQVPTDTDGDGVPDSTDQCPTEAGPASNNGCQVQPSDTDGDGVLDENDECPTEAGPVSNNGCSVQPPEGNGNNDGVPPTTVGDPGTSEEVDEQGFIPVTSDQLTELSCVEPSAMLQAAGFQITFSGLCGYSTTLRKIPEDGVSDTLPEGSSFVSSIRIELLQDGKPVNSIPADTSITISFNIPEDMNVDSLAILYWDQNGNGDTGAWLEQTVTVVGGHLMVTIGQPGAFVVVNNSASAHSPSQPFAAENDLLASFVDWLSNLVMTFNIN